MNVRYGVVKSRIDDLNILANDGYTYPYIQKDGKKNFTYGRERCFLFACA